MKEMSTLICKPSVMCVNAERLLAITFQGSDWLPSHQLNRLPQGERCSPSTATHCSSTPPCVQWLSQVLMMMMVVQFPVVSVLSHPSLTHITLSSSSSSAYNKHMRMDLKIHATARNESQAVQKHIWWLKRTGAGTTSEYSDSYADVETISRILRCSVWWPSALHGDIGGSQPN